MPHVPLSASRYVFVNNISIHVAQYRIVILNQCTDILPYQCVSQSPIVTMQ